MAAPSDAPIAADGASARLPTCRNCGATVSGDYCAQCGQETRLQLPTFPAFMREAAGRYVAFDGRMWRTRWGLIGRPGFLTREYLQGRRRRYIRPARLFLVFYLMLFALIGFVQPPTSIGEQVVFVNSDDADDKSDDESGAKPQQKRADNAPVKVETKRKAVVATDSSTLVGLDEDLVPWLRWGGKEFPLPPELRKRYDHFKALPKEEKAEQLYAGVLRYGTYAMVALLPAFALLQKLAYLGRARRYPDRPRRYAEHLVYSAHLHAFAALMLMLLIVLPYGPVKAAIAVWIVYYVMRARQTVYGGRWWAGLLRAFVVLCAYGVLVAIAIACLLAVAVMLR
jgi:hypothetical protein